MRIILGTLLIVAAANSHSLTSGARAAPPQEAQTVALKVVKYDELQEMVRAQKGHIVVVDIWGDFCPPCKKMMPDLVKMQQKYAKDGVVVMTVSLDPVDQKDAALKFLRAQNVPGPNYLLDETADVWQKKFGNIGGPPALFIFDRNGKRARKFDSEDPDKPYGHEDVEKVVEELLKAKP